MHLCILVNTNFHYGYQTHTCASSGILGQRSSADFPYHPFTCLALIPPHTAIPHVTLFVAQRGSETWRPYWWLERANGKRIPPWQPSDYITCVYRLKFSMSDTGAQLGELPANESHVHITQSRWMFQGECQERTPGTRKSSPKSSHWPMPRQWMNIHTIGMPSWKDMQSWNHWGYVLCSRQYLIGNVWASQRALLAPEPGGMLPEAQVVWLSTFSVTRNWEGTERIQLKGELPNCTALHIQGHKN